MNPDEVENEMHIDTFDRAIGYIHWSNQKQKEAREEAKKETGNKRGGKEYVSI